MTAADHANTVRQALEWMANYNMTGTERTLHIDMQGKAREVLPALDALEAQAKAADITDNLINDLTRTAWHWKACVEVAEREAQDARLARTVGIGTMKQRARAAEAERDALREALAEAQHFCARPPGVCFDPALATDRTKAQP